MNSGVGRGTTNRVVQEQLDLSANVGYTEKTPNTDVELETRWNDISSASVARVWRYRNLIITITITTEYRTVKRTTSTIKTSFVENADRLPAE